MRFIPAPRRFVILFDWRWLPNAGTLAAILAAIVVALVSTRAQAAEIPRLTGQVTDLANALPTDHPDVDAALAGLRTAHDVRLYALFVRSNDGLSATEFAQQVWSVNGLGGRDVLLVVATDEQTARFWNAGGVADITDAELRDVQDRIVGPLLAGEAYDQAVIAAADSLGEAAATPANPGPDIPQLSGSITDLIDVLAGQRTEPERAIRELASREAIDYFVLIVRETESASINVYADEVARKNSLGGNDVLLVVAFNQQGFFTEYGSAMWRGDALPEITDEELRDIATNQVGMAISEGFDFVKAIVDSAAALAAAKHAEEIPLIQASITDTSGVLDGRHDEIQAAIDALEEETGVDFYALFVKTTGNTSISEFASATVDKNDRLRGTYVLLTVAVDDRTDVISKDERLTEITRDEILDFLTTEVDPLITVRNYTGAVIAAVVAVERTFLDVTPTPSASPATTATSGVPIGGPDDEGEPSETETGGDGGGIPIGPVLAVGAIIVGGLVLFSRLRRGVASGRRSRAAEAEQQQAIAALSTEANELLLKADDGMRDAEQAVGFAEAEQGPAEVRSLREALALGKEELEVAFAIKQQLDDSEPEDPPAQRRMLTEIVERARGALTVVEEEHRKLNDLRDLERNAPQLLQKLSAEVPAIEAALAEAAKAYQRLQAYADSNWELVRGNVDQAGSTLEAARAQIAEGTKALAATDARSAARSALAAQAAISQTGSLVDAVSHTERSLLELQKALTDDLAAADQDLKAARTAVEEAAAEGFESALRDAEGDLRAAQALAIAPKPDLVTASRFVAQASTGANAIIAGTKGPGASVDSVREEHFLQSSLRDAEASLQRAQDVVGARRDTVSAGNRARLVQAEKTLRLARQMAARESKGTAIVAARRAEALSRAAYDPNFENVRLGFSATDQDMTANGTEEALKLVSQIMHVMGGASPRHSVVIQTTARSKDDA